jgi:hypothetical protein
VDESWRNNWGTSQFNADVYYAHNVFPATHRIAEAFRAKPLVVKPVEMPTTHSDRSGHGRFFPPAGADSHSCLQAAAGLVCSILFLFLTLAPGAGAQSGSQSITELVRQAQSSLDAGDFSRAAWNFEQALRLSPESPEVNRGLVLSYLQGGRLADAQRVAEIAVLRWPRDAELQHWLG